MRFEGGYVGFVGASCLTVLRRNPFPWIRDLSSEGNFVGLSLSGSFPSGSLEASTVPLLCSAADTPPLEWRGTAGFYPLEPCPCSAHGRNLLAPRRPSLIFQTDSY